ncbi:MurR/RpiR family transcriptional regulator [Rhizobium aegyptiacum]|uniref:MurR/RpiR family transcriptional regulator n=1 Tax=Rhizobium aegyptiacum TaxID=1764550 RepID=UPI0007E57A65
MVNLLSNPRTPANVGELRATIVAAPSHHSQAAKRIMEMAFRSPDLVAFGNAASFARVCRVSPSTVLRVARSFGFESFRDLRRLFHEEIKERATKRGIGNDLACKF